MESKLLHQSCGNGTKIFLKLIIMMVDEVIGNIKSVRKNIDSDFQVWYKQILDLAEKLGIVEASLRKTSSILRNRSNIPS